MRVHLERKDRRLTDNPKFHWDISIDTTQAALLRLAEGLLMTNSSLTDSMVPPGFNFGRGVSAHIRVRVPLGLEEFFWRWVRPITMAAPPMVGMGLSLQPEDSHPGRQDHWKERR